MGKMPLLRNSFANGPNLADHPIAYIPSTLNKTIKFYSDRAATANDAFNSVCAQADADLTGSFPDLIPYIYSVQFNQDGGNIYCYLGIYFGDASASGQILFP